MPRPRDNQYRSSSVSRRARHPAVEPLEARLVLSVSLRQPSTAKTLSEIEADVARLMTGQPFVPREVVAAVRTDQGADPLESIFSTSLYDRFPERSLVAGASTVLSTDADDGDQFALVNVEISPFYGVSEAMDLLSALDVVEWVSPNFVYEADPRELVPNDPSYPQQQFYHDLLNNPAAWDLTLGDASIIIAVTDDGVDVDHVDLAPNIWTNTGEIPGNGIDDDFNGFIDDVNGWDFSSNDNDPNPVGNDSHGTHVAGIAAARTNNALGVAGTAGAATIMPIRFYGSGAWTSTVIASSYAYAVDNGAQIINTSYNVDQFLGDPVFETGLQYLYDAGGLHFNSAGNNNELNPSRQNYHQSLYVANTTSADTKSGSSNYGTGIDISAPGTSIFATTPNDTYGTKSGTSMASPNAAGVAALIWSLNPGWTRDQVAAQLLGTADNIDALNPAFAGFLGTGRANSFRALTEALAAPRIETVTELPAEGGTIEQPLSLLTVELASVFDAATVSNAANWQLRSDGLDDTFGTPDDQLVPLTLATTYMIGTNDLVFRVGAMPEERYELRAVSDGLTDPFGTALDGNGDGTAGDDYVRTFVFDRPDVDWQRTEPLGSLIAGYEESGRVFGDGVAETYTTPFIQGQHFAATIAPHDATATLTATLSNSGGVVAVASSSSPGAAATFTQVDITASDDYTLSIVSDTTTSYDLDLNLNAQHEAEPITAATNNTRGTAEPLAPSELVLSDVVSRMAVLGRTDGGNYTDEQSQNDTLYSPTPHEFVFANAPTSTGSGSIHITAVGDLNASSEFLTVEAEGIPLGDVFVVGGSQGGISSTSIAVSAANWTTLTADGMVEVTVTPSTGIANLGSSQLTVGIDYAAGAVANDYYAVDLVAGELLTVALRSLTGGTIAVQVENDLGAVMSSGAPAGTEVDSYAPAFSAPSTDTYFIRVSGDGGVQYAVVATVGADLNIEPDTGLGGSPTLIDTTRRALGFLVAEPAPLLGTVDFVIDPLQSTVTLSGDVQTVPIVPQLPGSDTTELMGTVRVNLTPGGVEFVGGSIIDAVAQPGPFHPNSAPADFGLEVELIPGSLTAYGAIRGAVVDADSGVLSVDGLGEFDVSEISTEFIGGIFDYDVPGIVTDSQALFGLSAGNESAFSGSITTLPDQIELTIPLQTTTVLEEPNFNLVLTLIMTGELVAYADRPQPADLEDEYELYLTAGQQVVISTSTPLDEVTGVPLNDLDPSLTIYNLGGTPVATDLNSAGDGKNAQLIFSAPASGVYKIGVSAESGTGEYVLDVRNLELPVADAGGPYVVTEGDSVLLDASSSSGTITLYEWDLDNDGSYDDATGITTNFNADDDGPLTVGLRATGPLGSSTDSVVVTAVSAPPTAAVSGPTQAAQGQPVTFTFTATDPSPIDQAANFTFHIDWDGDWVVDETVVGPSGQQVTHAFPAAATYNVQVAAEDKDAHTGPVAGQNVEVSKYLLGPDPNNPGQTALFYGGSDSANGDVIALYGGTGTLFVLEIDPLGPSTALETISGITGDVYVYGQSGDDYLIGEYATVPIHVDGGAGDDVIYGGLMSDVLDGGLGNDVVHGGRAGDDTLLGAAGLDLLIGGLGADLLDGGVDGDLLIGGTIPGLDNVGSLFGLRAEWTSANTYADRINHLTGTPGGANGTTFLVPGSTVENDGAVDTLMGTDGMDWFLATIVDDILDDEPGETVTDVP